ncbi:thioredoxin family protein [Pseudonocardia sp.]|uniref:thioredoxin family protein n=1 Tax=Pseudonocardia sp. TaxID=60912 RepID=UPI002638582C|nr:thioredoxin family protein [Pseudonocardia sp.]
MDLVGATALVGVLVLATGAGLVLRARDGRVRPGRPPRAGTGRGRATGGWALAGRAPGPAERVLLLQLSSPVCTPCRRTADLLDGLHARRPEIVHREVDVAERPDVARALDVLRTPTVVAFDRAGTELLRVSGVPRVADLEAALTPALTA